jgi:hypothetical protein
MARQNLSGLHLFAPIVKNQVKRLVRKIEVNKWRNTGNLGQEQNINNLP